MDILLVLSQSDTSHAAPSWYYTLTTDLAHVLLGLLASLIEQAWKPGMWIVAALLAGMIVKEIFGDLPQGGSPFDSVKDVLLVLLGVAIPPIAFYASWRGK